MKKISKINKKFLSVILVLCLTICYTISINNNTVTAKADTNHCYVLENNATYMIKNVYTGLYLDIAYSSTEAGAEVLQYFDCKTDNQKFILKYINNKWKLCPKHAQNENMVLDVPNASSNNNVGLIIYNEFNSLAQGFSFENIENNIYKIRTSASNYAKWLGIENNSTSLSARVVQTSNETTAQWEFVKLSPTTVNGVYIEDGDELPEPCAHDVFGVPTFVSDGFCKDRRIDYDYLIGTYGTEEYNKYYYRIYEYDNLLDTEVKRYMYYEINPGQTVSPILSTNITTNNTIGQTVQESISQTIAFGGKIGVSAYNCKAEMNTQQSYTATLQNEFSYSQSITMSTGVVSSGYSITNNTNEVIYARFSHRAKFKCYVIQLFELQYDLEIIDGLFRDDYVYTLTGFLGKEEEMAWSISDGPYLSFSRYIYDSQLGYSVYNDSCINGCVYV